MLEQISDNRKNDMIKAIEDTLYKYKENQVINNVIQNKMKIFILFFGKNKKIVILH